MPPGSRRRERGFVYLLAIALVAVAAIATSVALPRWTDGTLRDREQQLLRIGSLYARAIAGYRRASPGSLKSYPPTLDALLDDRRFIGGVRHLRELYPDPLSPQRPWGVVTAPDGGVAGVFSLDERVPFRRQAVDLAGVVLPAAGSYRDWKFTAEGVR